MRHPDGTYDLTIEDIHEIRERNYEITKNMTTKNQENYARAKALFLQSKEHTNRASAVYFLLKAGCASRFFSRRLFNSLQKRGILLFPEVIFYDERRTDCKKQQKYI